MSDELNTPAPEGNLPAGEPSGSVEGQTPAPEPVSLRDDQLVEVLVNGKPERLPWKEAKASIMRQQDYTQKTQLTAEERRNLKELYDQVRTRADQVAEKEAALDAILGRAPRTPAQNQLPDDEIITAGQLREILSNHARSLHEGVNRTVQETQSQAESERQWQRWEDKTSETVGALTREHPDLADIPNLDVVLKREALKERPQTEADMFAAMLRAGQNLATKLDERFTARQKELALKKSKLTQNGPEPKGGTPQFTSKKTYGTGRTIDWKDIERDVMAAISAVED